MQLPPGRDLRLAEWAFRRRLPHLLTGVEMDPESRRLPWWTAVSTTFIASMLALWTVIWIVVVLVRA